MLGIRGIATRLVQYDQATAVICEYVTTNEEDHYNSKCDQGNVNIKGRRTCVQSSYINVPRFD